MSEARLTAKQKAFCDEYLIDLNQTQAAIRAGYSKKTAQEIGSENLSKPIIREYIDIRLAKRTQRTEITADYVLKTIRETVDEARHEGDRINTLRGCELLGKHLKLFTDKTEITGANGGPIKSTWEVLPIAATKSKQN